MMTRTQWFLYLTKTLTFALLAAGNFCPPDHPFAYHEGKFCCTYEWEKDCGNLGRGCNGGILGNSSTCCKNDRYVPCKHKTCKSLDCGYRPTLASRIIRGDKAVRNSYPWMISFRLFGVHYCGGTLIEEGYVLTAAHCLSTAIIAGWVGVKNQTAEYIIPRVKVVAGDHEVKTTQPEEQIFSIANFTVLKPATNRSGVPLFNDVAVVKLNKKAKFNNYVSPICLAESSMEEIPAGTEVTVAGWGISRRPVFDPELGIRYPEKYSNVLKEAKMKVIDNKDCTNLFDPIDEFGNKVFLAHPAGEDMICTREENERGDTSNGDSGSPLMIKVEESERWIQVGILSYGFGRSGENAYSKVSFFNKKISEMIKKLEEHKENS